MSFVHFTDRDLGKRFPEILKSGGLTVERHADHFANDTPDEVWLEAVGKRGWIALTLDRVAVMPARVAGIHVLRTERAKDVDGRNESGHDAFGGVVADSATDP